MDGLLLVAVTSWALTGCGRAGPGPVENTWSTVRVQDALRSDARALGDCATNAALLQTKTELRSTLPCVRVQALRERFRSRYDSLDEVCVLQ